MFDFYKGKRKVKKECKKCESKVMNYILPNYSEIHPHFICPKCCDTQFDNDEKIEYLEDE